jgi:hypothetical protein
LARRNATADEVNSTMPADARLPNNGGVALPLLFGLVVYLAVIVAGPRILDDPDTYSHVAIGQWMIAHAAIPHYDVFSFSMRGTPWVPDEWLGEVVLAWLYTHLGWGGLVLSTALAFSAALALLVHALARTLDPPYALIGGMTAWGLCFPHLTARPNVFGLLLLVIWTASLVAARSAGRSPALWLVPVMAIWANLHGSFMLGLALAALFSGEALYEATSAREVRRAALHWGIFLLLAALAACATPNGFAGILMPLKLVRMQFAMSIVDEWQSPNFQQLQPLEFWLMLAFLGLLSLRLRLSLPRIVILLALLHMALLHKRFAETVGVAAPLIVAPMFAPQLPRLDWPRLKGTMARLDKKLVTFSGIIVAAVLAFAPAATELRIGVKHDSGRFAPAGALATVATHQISGPVFNALNFGSYLIFRGIAPFIDGRVDVYGDAFIRRYATSADLPELLAKYQITWTLLEPGDPHIAVLDQMQGWRRLYADEFAVVHIRQRN